MPDAELELKLKKLLAGAIWAMFDEDSDILSHKLSEWAPAAQVFARMYAREFCGYSIDAEYDREGSEGDFKQKEIARKRKKDGGRKGSVRPDVVVHERGNDDNNLLVVEFKNEKDSMKDQAKVQLLMGAPRNYRFGATVVLNPPSGPPEWRWFSQAHPQPNLVEVPRPH